MKQQTGTAPKRSKSSNSDWPEPNHNGPQAEIAERAYALWQQAGRPAGRDTEFWLQAEHELEAEHQRREKTAHH